MPPLTSTFDFDLDYLSANDREYAVSSTQQSSQPADPHPAKRQKTAQYAVRLIHEEEAIPAPSQGQAQNLPCHETEEVEQESDEADASSEADTVQAGERGSSRKTHMIDDESSVEDDSDPDSDSSDASNSDSAIDPLPDWAKIFVPRDVTKTKSLGRVELVRSWQDLGVNGWMPKRILEKGKVGCKVWYLCEFKGSARVKPAAVLGIELRKVNIGLRKMVTKWEAEHKKKRFRVAAVHRG